jgi:hypothetical protein
MSTSNSTPPNSQAIMLGSWPFGRWALSRSFRVLREIIREAFFGLLRNRVRAGLSMLWISWASCRS